MKKSTLLLTFACAAACLVMTGCKKRTGGVWDDNQSAGNYKNSSRNLWGGSENEFAFADDLLGPTSEDFVPLKDDDLKASFADGAIPQPKHSPGELGSGLPGIDHFRAPSGELSSIFRTVYFNTDDHIVRGADSLAAIDRIATYLKKHPDVYIFVSGNCDERGPEAYNLALGTRRANYVRTMLVQRGVNSDRIHTISYGKERPVALGHTQEAWSKNRRAEFRVYDKR